MGHVRASPRSLAIRQLGPCSRRDDDFILTNRIFGQIHPVNLPLCLCPHAGLDQAHQAEQGFGVRDRHVMPASPLHDGAVDRSNLRGAAG